MRLIQLLDDAAATRVGVVDDDGGQVRLLDGISSMYDLARAAIAAGHTLEQAARAQKGDKTLSYRDALSGQRVLSPLHHPDPAHCLVTGTGLTHLGSAAARDAMHQQLKQKADHELTDSMKMFQWGVEGGIPRDGQPG
ncbi:MAG: AraD1 family protein, partial [Dyella sp.]